MQYEMDLKNFDIQMTSESISDKVKKALIENHKGKSTLIIAIEDADGVSVIPAGKAEDILTLIVIEIVQIIRVYKIADVDGLLECLVNQVMTTFEGNGD